MKALGLVMLLAAAPAGAGDLSDLIMAPGVLADAPAGEVLRYAHNRRLPGLEQGAVLPGAESGVAAPEAIVGGEAVLTAEGETLVLTLAEAGERQEVARFPAGGANPILLFFLENMVRNATMQTGGSPYYIRNRIRDALVGSDLGIAQGDTSVVVLHPFKEDSHRDQLDDFADLSITIVFDPARPDRIIELLADTGSQPGSYSESLRLIPEE